MGIYYIIVNHTKKEYLDSGDLGFGLKEYAYEFFCAPLIGYISYRSYYSVSSPGKECNHKEHNDPDFSMRGHWAGDDVELVSEHNDIYIEIWEDEKYNDNKIWLNISKQLKEEWNKEVDEFFNSDSFKSEEDNDYKWRQVFKVQKI